MYFFYSLKGNNENLEKSFAITPKSDNFKESNQEKKQRTGTKNETKIIKSDNFTGSIIERSKIAIAVLEQGQKRP